MSMFRSLMMQGAESPYFELTVKPTADSLTYGITLGIGSSGKCVIDWGDGATTEITKTANNITHSYSEAGTYLIRMRGTNVTQFSTVSAYTALLYGCNCNFAALGTALSGFGMFSDTTANLVIPKPITFPAWMGTLDRAFLRCKGTATIAKVQADTVSIRYMLNAASNLVCNLDTAFADVSHITGSMEFAFYGVSGVTGSVASFMRKVSAELTQTSMFAGTSCTPFGTSDYFEITINNAVAGESWGFTPTSSAATWYVFDWGDGDAVSTYKNLSTFTSGTKVSHTWKTGGTKVVKLAMNCSAISFDTYDSDNGKWEMLGNPPHGITSVTVASTDMPAYNGTYSEVSTGIWQMTDGSAHYINYLTTYGTAAWYLSAISGDISASPGALPQAETSITDRPCNTDGTTLTWTMNTTVTGN